MAKGGALRPAGTQPAGTQRWGGGNGAEITSSAVITRLRRFFSLDTLRLQPDITLVFELIHSDFLPKTISPPPLTS